MQEGSPFCARLGNRFAVSGHRQQHAAIAGRDVALTSGMSVMAEVKTGDRRVLEFLLDPLMEMADGAFHER